LVKSFEVGKPDSFKFIHRKQDLLKGVNGKSSWFEIIRIGFASHAAALKWPGHKVLLELLAYANNIGKKSFCQDMEALEKQRGADIWFADAEGKQRFLDNLLLEAGQARRV